MALRSLSTRRILRPVVGLTIAGTALLGFAGVASADSSVSGVTAAACSGGTANRDVTVGYSTNAAFTTGVRILAVQGSPGGAVVKSIEVPINGITKTTITITGLPAGTYWFDWQDADGGGVYSARHSTLGDFYNGIFLATETIVAPCVVETTTTAAATTTTIATTTTAAATTTTAAATTTTSVVVAPPTTPAAAATTSTTVVVNPPTTAVVQTTAAASANTLPATGSNSTPLVAAGVTFLGLGMVAVLSTRRRRPAHEA